MSLALLWRQTNFEISNDLGAPLYLFLFSYAGALMLVIFQIEVKLFTPCWPWGGCVFYPLNGCGLVCWTFAMRESAFSSSNSMGSSCLQIAWLCRKLQNWRHSLVHMSYGQDQARGIIHRFPCPKWPMCHYHLNIYATILTRLH